MSWLAGYDTPFAGALAVAAEKIVTDRYGAGVMLLIPSLELGAAHDVQNGTAGAEAAAVAPATVDLADGLGAFAPVGIGPKLPIVCAADAADLVHPRTG